MKIGARPTYRSSTNEEANMQKVNEARRRPRDARIYSKKSGSRSTDGSFLSLAMGMGRLALDSGAIMSFLPGSRGRIGLSPEKQAFLKEVAAYGSARDYCIRKGKKMKISELRALAKVYSKKLSTPLYLVGDVLKDELAIFRDKWMSEQRKELAALERHPDRYFALLSRYWDDVKYQRTLVGNYFGTDAIQFEESHPDLREHVSRNDELRRRLDGRLEEEKSALPVKAGVLAFDARGALAELKKLSEARKLAGYFYAKVLDEETHVDSYLITSNGKIVSTIPYSSMGPWSPDMYLSDPGVFLRRRKFNPQAGHLECASLGLSYFNAYLKNGRHGIERQTLLIAGRYDGRDFKFHLPSPQVLRYSQSSVYLKLIRAMVQGRGELESVRHRGAEYRVPTVMALKRSGAEVKRACGDEELSEAEIAAFAADWVASAEIEFKKRNDMTLDGTNLGLTRKTQVFKERARALLDVA